MNELLYGFDNNPDGSGEYENGFNCCRDVLNFGVAEGMFLVGGSAGYPDSKKAMRAAIRSIPECMASESTDTEPMTIPTISLNTTNTLLEATDSAATLVFFLCSLIFNYKKIPQDT